MGAFHPLSGAGIYQPCKVYKTTAKAADVDAAVAAASGLRLMGVTIRESAGSAAVATFKIVHGAAVSGGSVLVPIELAANASEEMWFGPNGIACASGLSIDRVAGTADIYLYYTTVTE